MASLPPPPMTSPGRTTLADNLRARPGDGESSDEEGGEGGEGGGDGGGGDKGGVGSSWASDSARPATGPLASASRCVGSVVSLAALGSLIT